jgi:hypothetical protein
MHKDVDIESQQKKKNKEVRDHLDHTMSQRVTILRNHFSNSCLILELMYMENL